MKLLFAFLSAVAAFAAQPFTVGVRAGVPMTDFISTMRSGSAAYTSTTNRYIVGPSAELRLPFGLGIEFDALYRHFSYRGAGASFGTQVTSSTSSGAWEFPLLVKYRFATPMVRPYVDAGVAWDRLSGIKSTISQVAGTASSSSAVQAVGLVKNTVPGFVVGGGLDIHAIFLHVSPEIRFTRWNSQHFADGTSGLFNSNRNQAEFLVGITF